jgi:hypothetical protein
VRQDIAVVLGCLGALLGESFQIFLHSMFTGTMRLD